MQPTPYKAAVDAIPETDFSPQVLPPLLLTNINGAFVVTFCPAAAQTAVEPVPVQDTALNIKLVCPAIDCEVQVLPPFVVTSNKGTFAISSCPATAQMAEEPSPVQLAADRSPRSVRPDAVTWVRSVSPIRALRKDRSGGVGTLPTATQMAVEPLPVQLAAFNVPAVAPPETDFTAQVLPPFIVTASKGAVLVCPTAAQTADEPAPVQLTP